MNTDFEMVAKTLYGFEELLENELKQLNSRYLKNVIKQKIKICLSDIKNLKNKLN